MTSCLSKVPFPGVLPEGHGQPVMGALCLSSGSNQARAFADRCASPFATAVFIIMRKVICVNQHKFGVSDLIKPGKMYDSAHTL